MKFSKKILLVCTLLSAQQVSLFAAETSGALAAGLSASNFSDDVTFLKIFMAKSIIPGQLTQDDFEQAQAAKLRLNNLPGNKKTDEILRLLERVQPVVERGMPEYVVTEQVESGMVQPTGGPDVLKPTVTMMMNYLSKPAAQRTAKDYELAKRAYAAFGKYVGGTLQVDAPRFVDMSAMADAKAEFTQAVREMVDSSWNMITNRPIAKNKYERPVVVIGARYWSFNQNNNGSDIRNILRASLVSHFKNDEESLNKYVEELMSKMRSINMQVVSTNDIGTTDSVALFQILNNVINRLNFANSWENLSNSPSDQWTEDIVSRIANIPVSERARAFSVVERALINKYTSMQSSDAQGDAKKYIEYLKRQVASGGKIVEMDELIIDEPIEGDGF